MGAVPAPVPGPLAPDEAAELRSTAVAVAGLVGDLVRRERAGAVAAAVATKSSATDVVTAADTAAERLARRLLAAWRPGDAVLGEEEGGAAAPGQLCWVVDPIDGTVNYLYGLPWYAVSVAVQRDGVSLAGAVAQPGTGRTWSAALGAGADLDGAPLRVAGPATLDLALLGTGFSYRAERRARQAALVAALLPRVRDVRRTGSAALDLCGVASGWLDAYAEHGLHRWDWAAGALVAQEAGAVVRVPAPGAAHGDDLTVAAAPGIAAELLAALAAAGAGDV